MTVHVSLREAKARLSEILDRAARGEEVEIVRRGAKPGRFRVLPVEADAVLRRPGAMRGAFVLPDDFDAEDPKVAALFEGTGFEGTGTGGAGSGGAGGDDAGGR